MRIPGSHVINTAGNPAPSADTLAIPLDVTTMVSYFLYRGKKDFWPFLVQFLDIYFQTVAGIHETRNFTYGCTRSYSLVSKNMEIVFFFVSHSALQMYGASAIVLTSFSTVVMAGENFCSDVEEAWIFCFWLNSADGWKPFPWWRSFLFCAGAARWSLPTPAPGSLSSTLRSHLFGWDTRWVDVVDSGSPQSHPHTAQ